MESPVDTSTNFEAQNEATVIIEDFSYKPASITVNVGTTVTWVQKDRITSYNVCYTKLLRFKISYPLINNSYTYSP